MRAYRSLAARHHLEVGIRQSVALITGAAGEIGQALIHRLSDNGIVLATLDLAPLDASLTARVSRVYTGSILDHGLLDAIQADCDVHHIYHLAALLSTRSEFSPVEAHEVNVTGTLNLLEFAMFQARNHVQPVMFFYPSSIAAYGVPANIGDQPVREHEYNTPRTMYGSNKLYCEHLGRYYALYYKQLDTEMHANLIDFRSIRFPGLISAQTIPSGGTSDYASEMIHAAAKGEAFACFVRPNTRIPFMAMPDAIDAILALTGEVRTNLSQSVYNVSAFNPSADEIQELVAKAYPDSLVTFEPDNRRQAIVDSWPTAVDDRTARRDWEYSPRYDFGPCFQDYLIPTIAEIYR